MLPRTTVNDEEAQLMRRVAAGDVAAFTTLVERVLPRLLDRNNPDLRAVEVDQTYFPGTDCVVDA